MSRVAAEQSSALEHGSTLTRYKLRSMSRDEVLRLLSRQRDEISRREAELSELGSGTKLLTDAYINAVYGVDQKFGTVILYVLTLPNINRFSNYFTTRIRRKFVIVLSLKIQSYLKCVATLPCEMSSVLKATIENKMTSQCVR